LTIGYKDSTPNSLIRTLQLNSNPKIRTFSNDLTSGEWKPLLVILSRFGYSTGLKSIPDNRELELILNFVKREFPDFTKEECDEAFSLYLAQKLEFKDSHYNSFSSLFIGNILNSYRTYRQTNLTKLSAYKKPDVKLEVPTKMKFMHTNFKPKYNKMLEDGKPFNECFSNIDSWLFYTSLDECGILNIPKEERQKVWDEIRKDISWFTPKLHHKKPDQDDFIKQCKIILFKDWVNLQIDSLTSFDELLRL
jgi:hypothetical protein